MLLALIPLMFCGAPKKAEIDYNFPAPAIKIANDHAVAIAVYYYMEEEEYNKRIEAARNARRNPYYLETIIPLGKCNNFTGYSVSDNYVIAYLGAGGIIGDNHVLTVRHLFVHTDNTLANRIFVFQQNAMMAVDSTVVAITDGTDPSVDYAVLKMGVDLNLPGIKLSQTDAVAGELVIYVGSTGGMAWHTRFTRATYASRYFGVDEVGILHLAWWEEFPFLEVYPGGPGDSGGIVLDRTGKMVGIMYCGIENYSEQYIFANPIAMAWDFLKANHLDGLVK